MGRRCFAMRDIIEIYQHWQSGRRFRSIARSLGVERNTVRKYIRAAVEGGFRQDGQNTPEEWKAFVREHFSKVIDQTARSGCFGELDK